MSSYKNENENNVQINPKILSLVYTNVDFINRLNAELNPICHLPALLGTHLILHVSRKRVNVAVGCAITYIVITRL